MIKRGKGVSIIQSMQKGLRKAGSIWEREGGSEEKTGGADEQEREWHVNPPVHAARAAQGRIRLRRREGEGERGG